MLLKNRVARQLSAKMLAVIPHKHFSPASLLRLSFPTFLQHNVVRDDQRDSNYQNAHEDSHHNSPFSSLFCEIVVIVDCEALWPEWIVADRQAHPG